MFDFARQAAVAAVVTCTLASGVLAQDETGPKVDAKADAILKRVVEHYHDVKALSCDVDLAMSMAMGDMKQNVDVTIAFAAERPNQFSIRLSDGNTQMQVTSDGEHLYSFLPALDRYTKVDAPESFDEIPFEVTMLTNITGGGEMPLILGLLGENGYENAMAGVTELSFVGEETLEGDVKTNHIKLARMEMDLDVWVAAGETPWIVKMSPDIQKAINDMAAANPDMPAPNMTGTANFDIKNWSTEKPATDVFAFAAPESAKEVEELFPQPESMQQPDSSELVNQPAPDFTLELFGSDKQITLADHKGKDIVILDFWATWCGPCKLGLPIMDEVTKAYADKNVVFYSVDLAGAERSDNDLPNLMKEKGWNFNVLIDRDGKVADAYRVGPIPHSVIISKDGIIEAVHIGIPRNLDDLKPRLQRELDELLETGKLSDEPHE